MASYIVEGGERLEGEVNVSGSKNASLPIMERKNMRLQQLM